MDALLAEELSQALPVETATDRRLVELAVRGEPGAFGQLYQRHVDGVYNYVCFRVRDEALAEDLTQDVFVSALKGIGGLRERHKFGHWLLRIAHNRVLNHWRAETARPEEPGWMASTPGGDRGRASTQALMDSRASEEMERRLAVDDVMTASARLTDLQQQVIALRFVSGLSVAETADAMGRSVGAVKNLQHHALAALRRQLPSGGAET